MGSPESLLTAGVGIVDLEEVTSQSKAVEADGGEGSMRQHRNSPRPESPSADPETGPHTRFLRSRCNCSCPQSWPTPGRRPVCPPGFPGGTADSDPGEGL